MAEIKKQSKTAVTRQSEPTAQTKETKVASATIKPVSTSLFSKDNYRWMLIGGIVIVLGMFLLSGGKNKDSNTFDYNVVYSTVRITVAPLLILFGLFIEVYAIFKKPKVNQ